MTYRVQVSKESNMNKEKMRDLHLAESVPALDSDAQGSRAKRFASSEVRDFEPLSRCL